MPSNIVASIVEQLREYGVFTRGEIGIQAQTITPEWLRVWALIAMLELFSPMCT